MCPQIFYIFEISAISWQINFLGTMLILLYFPLSQNRESYIINSRRWKFFFVFSSKNENKFHVRHTFADFSITLLCELKAQQFFHYLGWEEISTMLPFYIKLLFFEVSRIFWKRIQIDSMQTQDTSLTWNLVFRANFFAK